MEIETMRDLLNKMVESETSTYSEILEVSRKLDILIVKEYQKYLHNRNA